MEHIVSGPPCGLQWAFDHRPSDLVLYHPVSTSSRVRSEWSSGAGRRSPLLGPGLSSAAMMRVVAWSPESGAQEFRAPGLSQAESASSGLAG